MRTALLLTSSLCLTACADEQSETDRAEQDAATVAMVREANDRPPPLEEVVPEAILYPDIERHDLFGEACAYAPGTSMGVRVIARKVDAYMKIDGEMLRFSADPGSRELPSSSHSLYDSRTYSLRLAIDGDGVAEEDSVGVRLYDGTIWLRDRWDRVVYQGTGTVSCGA